MWQKAQLRELALGLNPIHHSFTYTYPPPYFARRGSVPGGLTAEIIRSWQDFSMYLHVPFCRMSCNFCSLHRKLSRDDAEVDSHLSALRQELCAFGKWVRSPRLLSLYLGGGTPSMLRAEQVHELLDLVPRSGAAEVTMECAPDADRDESQWRAFLRGLVTRPQLPITRVSVGVQSLRPDTLSRMGRGAPETITRLLRAVDDLIPTYNVDFILGYPHAAATMVDEAWEILRGVDELRRHGLRVPSVSVYQLWDVDRIPATRRRTHRLPDSAMVVEALWCVQNGLYDRGYGSSAGTTFVRGSEHRHQWAAHRYRDFRHLGFGSGSYSYLPSGFAQRSRDLAGYRRLLSDSSVSWPEIDGTLNAVFHLTPDDVEIRRVIAGLRSGAPIPLSTPASDRPRINEILDKVRQLCDLGILRRQDGTVALPEENFMLTNAVSTFLHPSDVPRKPVAADA